MRCRWTSIALLVAVDCSRGRPAPAVADLAPVAPAQQAMVSQALDHLTDGPFGYGDGFARLVAIGPAAFPTLKQLIEAGRVSDYDRLILIAQAVGRMKSPEAEPVLMAILEADKATESDVLLALGDSKAPTALPRLRAALSSPSRLIRTAGIEGLKRLGDARAVPDLLLIIERPDAPAVGLSAANRDEHPGRLHERAANAIDALTGQKLDGSTVRIRKWLATGPSR